MDPNNPNNPNPDVDPKNPPQDPPQDPPKEPEDPPKEPKEPVKPEPKEPEDDLSLFDRKEVDNDDDPNYEGKYVPLEKHKKVKEKKDEIISTLKEENERLRSRSADSDLVSDDEVTAFAEKHDITKELAKDMLENSSKQALKVVEREFGSKLKDLDNIKQSLTNREKFDAEYEQFVLPALSSDQKEKAQKLKDRVRKVALTKGYEKYPLLFIFNKIAQKEATTAPPETPRTGAIKKGQIDFKNVQEGDIERMDDETYEAYKTWLKAKG